jgi:hypothetical protein
MNKPKGGRGYKAPYETHQIRVPDPIADQVHILIERYQDYLAEGGNPTNPPSLLDQNNDVDAFLHNKNEVEKVLKQALMLKANAGGAIKRKIEEALILLGL